MPGMDGYETMRAIRAIDQFKSLPIIAVTGKVVAGERQRCIDAGATDYVPKPVDTVELRTALAPWLPIDPTPAERQPVAVLPSPELADVAPPSNATPRPSTNGGHGRIEGAKFLVVDDDVRNVFALTALLERSDAIVTTVDNGRAALAALLQAPDFDIVLMDIMMPGMDGYETMRAIRAIDQFKSLPIIAVTGKVVAGERQRCIDAGATDYVPKPVDTVELRTALAPWLPIAAARP